MRIVTRTAPELVAARPLTGALVEPLVMAGGGQLRRSLGPYEYGQGRREKIAGTVGGLLLLPRDARCAGQMALGANGVAGFGRQPGGIDDVFLHRAPGATRTDVFL